jgi:hypothetical protein
MATLPIIESPNSTTTRGSAAVGVRWGGSVVVVVGGAVVVVVSR